MNLIYRIFGNASPNANAGSCARANFHFTIKALVFPLLLSFGVNAYSLPAGGKVSAGNASISSGASSLIITQSTANAIINWQSFSIAQGEAVQFVQPTSSSVALNRVVGSDPSTILGNMSANGKVFLVNPNGILFGKGAQVNVGGLIASTLNISDDDFMSDNYKFSGAGNAELINQGTISTNADGGYVALLGTGVRSDGIITARLGTVVLASGNAITLDIVGDGLLSVTVNQGTVNALVQNGGLIQADGGTVILTTQATGNLLQNVVNNTGIIQAQTIDNHSGTIRLLAGMQSGTVNVGGTLAAQGGAYSGDGGFIETSGSHVVIADSAMINTLAPQGKTGLWLLDPLNWTIALSGGDETPAQVTTSLATSSQTITATNNIYVNAPIVLASAQALTLNAGHDVDINNSITGGAAAARLVLIAGNSVNVAAPLSVGAAGSSISISAGNDANITAPVGAAGAAYMITISAGHDVIASGAIGVVGAASAITITAGNDVSINNPESAVAAASSININAGRNVNVNASLSTAAAASSISLISGLNGTGPGVLGGTVIFSPLASVSTLNTTIRFNPVSYATTSSEIAAYSTKVAGVLDAKAWVFAQGNNKIYDGTNTATLSIEGNPRSSGNLILGFVSAAFDSQNTGTGKTIIYNGGSLIGVDANKFALFSTSGTTTGNIAPAPLTVTVANAMKTYGQTINLTGFTVTGLMNGEAIDAITESSPGAVATASVDGSPYVITPSPVTGGSFNAANYNIVYINGTLTVMP